MQSKSIYILLMFLMPFLSYSQEQPLLTEKANRHILMGEYAFAAKILEKEVTNHKPSTALLSKLAECYFLSNNFEKSIKYYEKSTAQPNVANSDWLNYGDALRLMGKYTEAKTAYLHLEERNTLAIQNKLKGCDSAMIWKKSPNFKVNNLKQLNTPLSDWGATPYLNNAVVFTSDSLRNGMIKNVQNRLFGRTAQKYQKLYIADNLNNSPINDFSKVLNFSPNHVGPICFNATMDTAYITYTNPNPVTLKQQKITANALKINRYGIRRLMLYQAISINGNWQKPTPFAYNKENEYSVGHAALSPDGQTLYFASDRPDGYGKTDIWYCVKTETGTWGNPINCGATINTADEEAFPTMDNLGNLYYSSKGKIGMGGFDIFKSTLNGNQWTNPMNLKYPINSDGDDFYLKMTDDNNKQGFLSSNRNGGLGSDDIYSFEMVKKEDKKTVVINNPKEKPLEKNSNSQLIGVLVKDEETQYPIPNTSVEVSCLLDAKGNKAKFVTNENGYFYFRKPKGADCKILPLSIDYRNSPLPIVVNNPNLDTVNLDVSIPHSIANLNLKEGDMFEIKNLLYDFNQSYIRPDAALILDELVALMTHKYPNMIIELGSHTDSRGTTEYNQKLSQRRATSAKQYLKDHGINDFRVTSIGYGEARLKNNCRDGVKCSEEDHQMNRRTEVKVLKLK